MAQAAGDNAGKLFQYGLPKVVGAGLVTEKYWPEIVKGLIEMAQAAGDNAGKLFQYGLPKVVGAGLVTEKYWPGLIKMAQAAGDNTDSLYWFGLPMVVEAGLVTEENWDKLVKLVKILSKNLDKKNIQNLFHKTLSQFILFHKVVDVNTIGDFTVAVVNKYGKGHQQISKIFKELVPLVESNEDLELLWSYLKISSVISFNLFKEYKNLDEKNRKAFLEDHKKRYSDIVLGKDTKFTVKNFPYILHAINSPSLSDQKLKQTLETYGKKASELPPTTFTSFNLKSIKDVGGLKVKGKLDEKLFTYYREFIQLINNSKPIEINYNELLAEKVKYSESILGTEFSFEIAWRVKMLEVFSNLGEAMKNKLIKITNEDFKSFSNDLFELRDVYNAFLELYNDILQIEANLIYLKQKLLRCKELHLSPIPYLKLYL